MAQNEVFNHFLGFGSLVFLKTYEKNFVAQIWAKQTEIGLEISFFVIFSSLFFSFKLNTKIACNIT